MCSQCLIIFCAVPVLVVQMGLRIAMKCAGSSSLTRILPTTGLMIVSQELLEATDLLCCFPASGFDFNVVLSQLSKCNVNRF